MNDQPDGLLNHSSEPAVSPVGDLTALLQGVLGSDPGAAIAQLTSGLRSNLAAARHEGVAGGGAVHVALNGEKRLLSIAISNEVFEAGDAATLEELIVAAANDAFEKAEAADDLSLGDLNGILGNH